MDQNSFRKSLSLVILVIVAFIFLGATKAPAGSEKEAQIVSLKDFTKMEVRGIGITLDKEIKIHISAVGGGDKSVWQDAFGDKESQQMYAAGWIINAKTRKLVWDMTMDNTSGRSNNRKCDEDITLKKGSYEVYYQAFGYASGGSFSMNIDRREPRRSTNRVFGGLLSLVGGDDRARYDDFMEFAKDRWGITLTAPDADASSVQTFDAPMSNDNTVLLKTHLGDNVVYRKMLDVGKEVRVHIYALGEGQKGDGVNDFGWIVNAETRQRVWDMNPRDVEYAGGASKNIKYDGDVALPRGKYEVYFVTDGSHSNDDWNSRPPYDPFNYGITMTLADDGDRGAIKVSDARDEEKNVIVKLTEMRDDEYKSAGFSLKQETPIRIYALGESENDDREMADYGWIVNAKTHERVWTMERDHTYHAGGATKNRLSDEIITLPKGDYVAYYQTDDSHSYNNWNSDEPFDPEHWGITIMGSGQSFDLKNVSMFAEGREEGVLAQLVRVGDDRHEHQRFSVPERSKVRIYAIGESSDDEMADYGWIENAETGHRIWEMEYDKTTWAGGAKKNRLFDKTITLDKGEYELHFKTDDSHAYNDWNDNPPDDRTHWGITVYKNE